jgi:hypothetical protein
LGRPLDRALFLGDDDVPDTAALNRLADAATDVFLAAYHKSTTD